MIVIIWIFNVLESNVSDWSNSAFCFCLVSLGVFCGFVLCFCIQLCEDLFQRAGQNSDPDLTYSVEVSRLLSVHLAESLWEPWVSDRFCPPLGVLHGDLLWAGAGPVESKVSGDSQGPGAPHPGSLRGGPVQTGCDWFHRHPGPDGRWQQSSVGVS